MTSQKRTIEMRMSENGPLMVYEDGEFKYKDPEMRAKAERRAKLRARVDYLKSRVARLHRYLERKGLLEKVGKTGDSTTGEVSAEQKEIGETHVAAAKTSIRIHRERHQMDRD